MTICNSRCRVGEHGVHCLMQKPAEHPLCDVGSILVADNAVVVACSQEPFVRAVDEYRAQLQSTMTFTAVGSLVAGAVAGLGIGFLIGRLAGRGSSSGGSK